MGAYQGATNVVLYSLEVLDRQDGLTLAHEWAHALDAATAATRSASSFQNVWEGTVPDESLARTLAVDEFGVFLNTHFLARLKAEHRWRFIDPSMEEKLKKTFEPSLKAWRSDVAPLLKEGGQEGYEAWRAWSLSTEKLLKTFFSEGLSDEPARLKEFAASMARQADMWRGFRADVRTLYDDLTADRKTLLRLSASWTPQADYWLDEGEIWARSFEVFVESCRKRHGTSSSKTEKRMNDPLYFAGTGAQESFISWWEEHRFLWENGLTASAPAARRQSKP